MGPEIIGTLAGIFTTAAVIPQIIKALRTKRVGDVSLWTYIIICAGVGLWTTYGILKMDWPIIITNGICFLLNIIMLFILYRQEETS